MRARALITIGLCAAVILSAVAYLMVSRPERSASPSVQPVSAPAKTATLAPRQPDHAEPRREGDEANWVAHREPRDRPEMKALLEQQRARLDELTKLKYGEPQAWPEEGSEAYRQESFEAALEAALKTCELASESHHLDCSEPPCIAVFVQPAFDDFQDLGRCAEWSQKYGEATSAYVKTATCDQGPVRFYMISPDWPDYFNTPDAALRDERLQRRGGRYKELEELVCDL